MKVATDAKVRIMKKNITSKKSSYFFTVATIDNGSVKDPVFQTLSRKVNNELFCIFAANIFGGIFNAECIRVLL